MTVLLTMLFKPKRRRQLWNHCQLASGFQGVIVLCDWGTWKHLLLSVTMTTIWSRSFSAPACSVQSLSHVWLCDPMDCSMPGLPVYSQSLLKLVSIESVMPSNHLILCHPLLLLPSIFPSVRVFSNESILHIRWPKYWSFSFSISPSNEYPGLISFRMDWLDLLAVQGTLKGLLACTILQLLFFPLIHSCALPFLHPSISHK